MNSKFEKRKAGKILSPFQGLTVFDSVSRADALRLILSPRWGGVSIKMKMRSKRGYGLQAVRLVVNVKVKVKED